MMQAQVNDLKQRRIDTRAEATAAQTMLAIAQQKAEAATDIRLKEFQRASELREGELQASVAELSGRLEETSTENIQLRKEQEELKKLVIMMSSSVERDLKYEAVRLTCNGSDMMSQLQLHLRADGLDGPRTDLNPALDPVLGRLQLDC